MAKSMLLVNQGPRSAREKDQVLPKMAHGRGSLHAEWKRCGKRACRCARGALHGPYWYHHERQAGRQRKVYVPGDQVATLRAGLAAWRREHPPVRSMRSRLAELRRVVRGLPSPEGSA